MIRVVEGNVVDAVLHGECDLMLHITNGQQTMASGVAKEVRERIPTAYTNYMKKPKNTVAISKSDCGKVINMTAQQYYGYDGARYLSYKALVMCLRQVRLLLEESTYNEPLKIAIPYNMGAVRSGGDWEVVKELVEGMLTGYEVIAYKLDNG